MVIILGRQKMKIINFLDGKHHIDDFFDQFEPEYFTVKYCHDWDDLYMWMQVLNNDEPKLSQLTSAKSLDDLFLRIQKAKNTMLAALDFSCGINDVPYPEEIKYDKKAGVYVDADQMQAYAGYADGSVCFCFTKLSKVPFKNAHSIYTWNSDHLILVFEYKDEVWTLTKGYY